MEPRIHVEPLSYKTRRNTFLFLFFVFAASLPFLYLYATGYRYDFARPTDIVSTGGIYIAVDRIGAEIYIDNELMRETRTFKKAFYAQSLDIGTHRVHVQKEGYHTWVKELPVSRHRVTEAEAFNLPLVPRVRVISDMKTATGTMVVRDLLEHASTTNFVMASSTFGTSTLIANDEFKSLISFFATTSTSTEKTTTADRLKEIIHDIATTTPRVTPESTTTISTSNVVLYERDGELYATWVGPFEQMPYYYCAPPFPPYSTTSPTTTVEGEIENTEPDEETDPLQSGYLMHPVQSIPKDVVCDQTIRIDRRNKVVEQFDFFPGSTDFVLIAEDDGLFVVEVDDRSWQNIQPLILGHNLKMHIENGAIYVYDGSLIYQIIPEP